MHITISASDWVRLQKAKRSCVEMVNTMGLCHHVCSSAARLSLASNVCRVWGPLGAGIYPFHQLNNFLFIFFPSPRVPRGCLVHVFSLFYFRSSYRCCCCLPPPPNHILIHPLTSSCRSILTVLPHRGEYIPQPVLSAEFSGKPRFWGKTVKYGVCCHHFWLGQ